MTDIKAGDLVRVKPQYARSGIFGIWIAEKMLTKNWELKRPADYNGMNAHKKLRAKPYQLEKVTAENTAVTPNALPPLNHAPAVQVTDVPIFREGQVVRVSDPSGKIRTDVPYVVTKGNITGDASRVNIAELGGGKMWRVTVHALTVIPMTNVLVDM